MHVGGETMSSAVLLVKSRLNGCRNCLTQGSDLSGNGAVPETSRLVESGKQFLIEELIQQGGVLRQRTHGVDIHFQTEFLLQLFVDIAGYPLKIVLRQQVCFAEQHNGGNAGLIKQAQRSYVFFVQCRSCVNQEQRKIAGWKVSQGLRAAASGQRAKSWSIHQHNAL